MVGAPGIRAFASGLCLLWLTPVSALADEVLYAAPPVEEVRSRVFEWVAARKVDDSAVLQELGRQWGTLPDTASAQDVFRAVIATFGLVDSATQAFIESCSLQRAPLIPPDAKLLARNDADEFYRAHLRLFYGQYLVQRQMYDEALAVLSELEPKEVVDPASCLFYRAVCHHELLQKPDGLAAIDALLKNTENVPVRQASVAKLMRYELQNLQEDSLDEISRLMRDVERRLDLGRGGPTVQKREYEIIAKLDEIIEKLESQGGS